jgi:hypothetical protein
MTETETSEKPEEGGSKQGVGLNPGLTDHDEKPPLPNPARPEITPTPEDENERSEARIMEQRKLELEQRKFELEQRKFELERFTKETLELKKLELERYTKATLERMKLNLEHLTKVDLERQKLEIERKKNNLDFVKFFLGSVVAAIAIAFIPPMFQYASAQLEKVKSDAQRERDSGIDEVSANKIRLDAAVLWLPSCTSIKCDENCAAVANHPAHRRIWKIDCQ